MNTLKKKVKCVSHSSTMLLAFLLLTFTFICYGSEFDLTNNTQKTLSTLVGIKVGESEDWFMKNQKNSERIKIIQQGIFRTTSEAIELETPFRMFKSFKPTFTPQSKKIASIHLSAYKDITPEDIKKYQNRMYLPMKVNDPIQEAKKWMEGGISIPDVLEKKYCIDNFPRSNILKKTDNKEMVIKIEDLGSWKSWVPWDCKSLKCNVQSIDYTIVFHKTALCYRFKAIICSEKEGLVRFESDLALLDPTLTKEAEKEWADLKNKREAIRIENKRKIEDGDVL